MKKRLICLLLSITFAMGFFNVSVFADVTLKLNGSKVTLGKGETYQITAKTNSSNSITWISSEKSVITVDKSGLVTAKAEGKATVTAKVEGTSADFIFNVKKAPDKITAKDITVSKGDTVQISASLPPGTASKKLTYKSSDTKIAKVSSKGMVTGISEGSCNVTITTFNGKSIEFKVDVTKPNALGNGTDFVVYGDWIYYVKATGNNDTLGIRKVRVDGTNNIKLSDKQPNSIYVSGDWIYFVITSRGKDFGIHRIGIDGKGYKKLSSDTPYMAKITIIDDWIYYKNYDEIYFENGGIKKIKIDGTIEKEILKSVGIEHYTVDGEWIYFVYCDPGHEVKGAKFHGIRDDGIYKINTDGKNLTFIKSGIFFANNFYLYNGFIYFFNQGLYKIKTDGTNEKLLKELTGYIYPYDFSDGWIYYSHDNGIYKINIEGKENVKIPSGTRVGSNYYYTENDNLYKINEDGTGKKKIISNIDKNSNFKVLDNWIYYRIDERMFRTKIDGSGTNKVLGNFIDELIEKMN